MNVIKRAMLLALLPVLGHAATPRVVTLSWEATEYVLALGLVPVAIADRDDYRAWVAEPALPASVGDAGSRLEPNLELLHQLKPDLIVTNTSLHGVLPQLSRIAPTLELDPFRLDHDNTAAAERLQRQLAVRLGRLPQHERFLAGESARYQRLRRQLAGHTGPRSVCVVRFATATSLWAYGENSSVEAVMTRLGLRNACPQPRSVWGARLRPLSDLRQLGAQPLLHITPFAHYDELQRAPLWQQLDFVRQGQVAALPAVWTHGGLWSNGRLAEALVAALIRLPLPAVTQSSSPRKPPL